MSKEKLSAIRERKLMDKAVQAAQSSYDANPEYGLTDDDMRKAIQAAVNELYRHGER